MRSDSTIAFGFALVFAMCATAQAQDNLFKGWGVTNYEKPAPMPAQVAPTPAAPTVAAKPSPHERLIAAHPPKEPTKTVALRDIPIAPTPAAQPAGPAPGPVEPAALTIRDLVTKHARENGVPEKLAAAVVSIESRFNPNARGGSALGLMQIKYDTARSMGYAGGVTALLAPETNLHFGMKVLADAYRSSRGDLCMTLARYQSGHLVTHASAANRAYCSRARSFMAKTS